MSTDTRLDRLSAQVELLTEELLAQRAERDRWRDLVRELMPVAQGAMDVMSRELEDLSREVTTEDVVRFLRTATRTLPRLEVMIAQLDSLAELISEVTSLTGDGMAKLSDGLATAQRKGYFEFARGSAAIADTIVTSFDANDVSALGDNIVLILNTLKELTQPEVMAMLQRTAVTVQAGETAPARPPSTLALLRQLRDPQVRLGLSRTLALLAGIGSSSQLPPAHTSKE